MPTTCPSRSTSAPPELPGLTAASIWKRPVSVWPVFGTVNERFSPETIPALTEP